jgi:peptidoglycan/xylan/chitin deacetylase (PgdA/CDA1 family)
VTKPNVLILADPEDVRALWKSPAETRNWKVFWNVVDFAQLRVGIEQIREQVKRNNIDFVMYSRDDQVDGRWSIGPLTKRLKIGYSSFSGIDRGDWRNQMGYCFRDFMKCNVVLGFEGEKIESLGTDMRKSFSILFDCEQLGGVKYGLPRILSLLRRHRARATFFLTNLMKKVYPDVCTIIRRDGHEIGVHGMWHEYLTELARPDQTRAVRDMVNDLGGPVCGANFLSRMNEETVAALVENGMSYFVYPMINYYKFAGYPKFQTTPTLLRLSDRKIWMMPISVETYGLPWISVKSMLDSAILQSLKHSEMHLSILCHDFRDGNLSHISNMNGMLDYLINVRRLQPVTLSEFVMYQTDTSDASSVPLTQGLFEGRSPRIVLPKTRQDLLAMLPENVVRLCRFAFKGRTVF